MKLILASSSPRRIELLKHTGLKFLSVSPAIDETQQKNESPYDMVERLSYLKSLSVAHSHVESLVIGADTTVIAPKSNKVLGKPLDKKDAIRILSLIQGKTHLVLTGYSVILIKKDHSLIARTRIVETSVTIKPLKRDEIIKYVLTNEPLDKAGAYAAQGIGGNFISKINGSYTNVVGLPMVELMKDLEFFYKRKQ